MRKTQIVEMERHRLADGGLARITRLGRTYNFMRSYPTAQQAPDCAVSITRAEAYRLLEDTLRRDVLELD